MKIPGWKYYNHAAVPTCAPHEEPNLSPLKDGSIWQITNDVGGGQSPLIIRYTTDFDCRQETAFWYIVKDAPFEFEKLSKKHRHHVRQALERCEVRMEDPVQCFGELWEVYNAAFDTYEGALNRQTEEQFRENVSSGRYDCFVARSSEDGKVAGWMLCTDNSTWAETCIAKYHPDRQKFRPSDAIHYTVLDYYLNQRGCKYVCSGSRNISHKTHVQDYKTEHWQFRRVYCKMHIEYVPWLRWLVKLLYPFRNLFAKLDIFKPVHALNGILTLEEITRQCKK